MLGAAGKSTSFMDNILRICTWNIHFGFQLQNILEQIQLHSEFSGLDLLALQEASNQNGVNDAELISQTLGEDYQYYQVPANIKKGHPQINALIWNTRSFQVTSKEHLILPDAQTTAVSFRDKLLHKVLRSGFRNGLFVEGTFYNKTVRVCVTHLSLHGRNQKLAQFKYILENFTQRNPTEISIIAGDFNTYTLIKRLKSKNQTFLQPEGKVAGFDDITTDIAWTFHYPRLRMLQKLDAIFVKPTPKTYHSWSFSIPGSDHMPVFANITLV